MGVCKFLVAHIIIGATIIVMEVTSLKANVWFLDNCNLMGCRPDFIHALNILKEECPPRGNGDFGKTTVWSHLHP